VILLLRIQHAPLVFIVVLAALRSLPREMSDAARMSGAGAGRMLRCIMLPCLRPRSQKSPRLHHRHDVRKGHRLALVKRDEKRGHTIPVVKGAQLALHGVAQMQAALASGSSIRIVRSSPARQRASATRCRSPPDSAPDRRSA
jgi:hypothetical protein